jgi:hypothetical protein
MVDADHERRAIAKIAANTVDRVPRNPAGIIFWVLAKRMAKMMLSATAVPSATAVMLCTYEYASTSDATALQGEETEQRSQSK